MLNQLRKLFTKHEPLIEAIHRQDLDELVRTLIATRLIVLGQPHGNGIDSNEITSDALTDLVKMELSHHRPEAPFVPLLIDCDGRDSITAFTNEKNAHKYLQQLASQSGKAIVIPTASIDGRAILKNLIEGLGVRINWTCPNECYLAFPDATIAKARQMMP